MESLLKSLYHNFFAGTKRNKDCPDYEIKNQGNMVFKESTVKIIMYSLNVKLVITALMKREVQYFFGLDTTEEEVLRTLATIPEKGSIRGVARATGHSKNTICRWLKIAVTHSKEVTAYFLRDLDLKRVEVDEIWSYIKFGWLYWYFMCRKDKSYN